MTQLAEEEMGEKKENITSSFFFPLPTGVPRVESNTVTSAPIMPVTQAKEDKALVPVSGTRTVEKAEKAQSHFSIPPLPPRGLRRS